MNTIKVKHPGEIPDDYTGIAVWENGFKVWLKNGKPHREDGPAKIWSDRSKSWYLNGMICWDSIWNQRNLRNKIILSKEQHPKYSTVQVWKYIDENGIREQVIIPGMEGFIIE